MSSGCFGTHDVSMCVAGLHGLLGSSPKVRVVGVRNGNCGLVAPSKRRTTHRRNVRILWLRLGEARVARADTRWHEYRCLWEVDLHCFTLFRCVYIRLGGSVVGSEPLVLVAGSSNIRTGKVGRLARYLQSLKSVIIFTPSKPHSKVTDTVASLIPVGCALIEGRGKLAICDYAKAPISYIGLTVGRILRHGPSLLTSKVGRNNGRTVYVRCSNAVKTTTRKYIFNVPSVNISLLSRHTSTSFTRDYHLKHVLTQQVVGRKLPRNACLGLGIPGIPGMGKVGMYQRTSKH